MTGGDEISDIQTQIAVLDASVVHKTGNLNESIDGQKLFTSDFAILNASTNIISSVSIILASAVNYLNGTQNRIGSSLPTASTSIGNKIDCIGGYNLMTSSTTSTLANQIEATGGASNAMTTTGAGNNILNAQGTGKNFLISQTNNNEIQAGGANLMLIGTTEKLNMTSALTTLTNGTTTINCNTGNFNVFATGDTSINVPNGKSHFLEVNGVDKVVVGQNSTTITNVANRLVSTGTSNYNELNGTENYNTFKVGGKSVVRYDNGSFTTDKLNINSVDSTLTNTNHTITATGDNTITTSSGNNFMTITGGSFKENILTANANSGLANRILGFNNYLTGSDTNYLFAPKNSMTANTTATATANLIDATGTGGGNTIRSATGSNTITSARTSANANIITATATGGNNIIQTTTGQNFINCTNGGVNLIQSVGGVNSQNVLYANGTIFNSNQIDANSGGNFIRASGDNTITSTSGSNKIQINGVDRLVIDNTSTTIYNRLKVQTRPFQWFLTGAGNNGTATSGTAIGRFISGQGYFSSISAYGGASTGAWDTTNAVFTAPSDGLYSIQFNVFQSTSSVVGRTIVLECASIPSTRQYMMFNMSQTTSEASYQCSQTLWLTSGQTFRFVNDGGASIQLFYGPTHTTLNIIRLY